MDDIRTTRTTPGFLAGRLLGILDLVRHDILRVDMDVRWEQIYGSIVTGHRPKAAIATLTKEWVSIAPRLKAHDPKRCAELDETWTWIVTNLDVDALADANRIDRGNEAVYGHAHERVYQTGRQTAEMRSVADEWVARAKTTAVAAVKAGMSESEAARLAGLSRLTVRIALGK